MVALFYPGLTSAATEEAIAAAAQADLIDIDHWQDKLGAHLAVDHLYRFMHEGEMRLSEPFDEDSPWRYLDEDRDQTGHEV